jgi:ABC-2 type transport system ATP-binding protein
MGIDNQPLTRDAKFIESPTGKMITATDLTKNYGELRAIDRISFEISRGECVGLLGLNGAGKTTLLRVLSCLLTPTAGQVTVDGKDVTQSADHVRAMIGYLPEDPPLYTEMKVGKFLEFAARLRGIPRSDVGGRVQDAARRCKLEDKIHQRIETLSYGYRKRVGIAQAIVHNPPLVILDEPIAGLDPAQIVDMRELVRGLRGQHTVVLSSHILTEISQTCDRILVMQEGRIVGSGTEDELTSGLSKEHKLSVHVRGPREKVQKVLDGLEAGDFKVIEVHEDVLRLEITTSGDIRAALSRAVVESGLDLLGLTRVQDQLETTFLRITGGKEDKS